MLIFQENCGNKVSKLTKKKKKWIKKIYITATFRVILLWKFIGKHMNLSLNFKNIDSLPFSAKIVSDPKSHSGCRCLLRFSDRSAGCSHGSSVCSRSLPVSTRLLNMRTCNRNHAINGPQPLHANSGRTVASQSNGWIYIHTRW